MSLKFEPVVAPEAEYMAQHTSRMYSHGLIRVQPSGCIMPASYQHRAMDIKNMTVYPDDVFVVTYPKCGTTWTQEMVWLLMNKVDFKTAHSVELWHRSPFVEYSSLLHPEDEKGVEVSDTFEAVQKAPRPRCIKTHLPLELLPDQIWIVKAKIVYVVRDPKDVAVSFYHHHIALNNYTGTMEKFIDAFLGDGVHWNPFWQHLIDFWDIKDRSNVLINTYEEMKSNLPNVIRSTAKFLEVSLTDKQVDQLKEHLSFEKMKNNAMVNYEPLFDTLRQKYEIKTSFMRHGTVGDGRKTLSPEMLERFFKWTTECCKGHSFPYYRNRN